MQFPPPAEPALGPRQHYAPQAGYYRAVALGCSAGGMDALKASLAGLPADYALPLLLVQHLHHTDDGRFASHLDRLLALAVAEAADKTQPQPGHLYVAPADYHLLVESGGQLALSSDERVNASRPAIDVLFESAARAWTDRLVVVILSGANHDGAEGALLARRLGAVVIAQAPESAGSPVMPLAAIRRGAASLVLPPEQIAPLLLALQHNRIVEEPKP